MDWTQSANKNKAKEHKSMKMSSHGYVPLLRGTPCLQGDVLWSTSVLEEEEENINENTKERLKNRAH